MKKIICKVEYDTENAELVAKFTSGEFGSADGYEESLYVTAGGKSHCQRKIREFPPRQRGSGPFLREYGRWCR